MLDYSPDGTQLLALCADGSTHLWRRDEAGPRQWLPGQQWKPEEAATDKSGRDRNPRTTLDACFSRDGSRIFLLRGQGGSASEFSVWQDGQCLARMPHGGDLPDAALEWNGRYVTGGEDACWLSRESNRPPRADLLRTWPLTGEILTCGFIPGGSRVLAISTDAKQGHGRNEILFYDPDGSPEPLLRIPQPSALSSCRISPDGDRIAAITARGPAAPLTVHYVLTH